MRRRRLATFAVVIAVLVLVIGTFILATVNRDQRLTLGTSVEGSESYAVARLLQAGLQERGFVVDVVPTERTADLIDLLADPASPVDVTFIQDTVDAGQYPTVTTLGSVSRQAYVFATWPRSHGIDSLSEMVGKRIDVGPEGSIRAAFVTDLLAQFEVTRGNSTFLHLPTRPTDAELAAADLDVTATVWDSRSPYLLEGLTAGDLRLVSVPEGRAVAHLVPSAEAVEIPTGIISLRPAVPADSVPTLAQLATVVADERVSPAAAYAIAQELVKIFSPGSAWSAPGEFPNFADRQLPVNPYAAEYYSTGAIPWQYRHLPPLLADSFVSLLILASVILLVGSVWSIFLPEAYTIWTGIIRPKSEERYLGAMERRIAGGGTLSATDQARLDAILRKHEAERELRDRAQNLRSQADGAVG